MSEEPKEGKIGNSVLIVEKLLLSPIHNTHVILSLECIGQGKDFSLTMIVESRQLAQGFLTKTYFETEINVFKPQTWYTVLMGLCFIILCQDSLICNNPFNFNATQVLE